MNDVELLKEYTNNHSEAAFTTLVERHIGMVYSAALRQVHDPHLAEELTQIVFMLLASKADSLLKRTVLSGWLYRTARFVALDALKKQHRRKQRELQAAQMQATAAEDSDWEQIAPLLDEAMSQLSEKDRDALVLRFFEGKSLAAVGAALGADPEAARKRVARALEILRVFFVRRGCAIPAATVASLLTAKAVQAAPTGLSSTISASATLSGTALHHAGTIGLTKTLAMTTLQKALMTTAITTAIGATIYESRRISTLQEQVQRLEQRQLPLALQNQQLNRERDEATNRLALAKEQLDSLRTNATELLKLRGEVSRWRRAALELAQAQNSKAQTSNDPIENLAKSWAAQVSQFKQKLERLPDKRIPELQFLNDQDWFDAVGEGKSVQTDVEVRQASDRLRRSAKNKFVPILQQAFTKYADSNDGQVPSDLSQLKPYFEPPVEDSILQRYQIAATGKLSDVPPQQPLVVERAPVDEDYDTMFLIYLKGAGVANAKGWPKGGFSGPVNNR
jgi:RNA polymerase sigma factor (sigma-70 family)